MAVLCVLVAAVLPVSVAKGRIRLLGSLSVGAGFAVMSLTQIVNENRLWPTAVLLFGGIFLIWVGLRKYRRDPEGKTPARSIL